MSMPSRSCGDRAAAATHASDVVIRSPLEFRRLIMFGGKRRTQQAAEMPASPRYRAQLHLAPP